MVSTSWFDILDLSYRYDEGYSNLPEDMLIRIACFLNGSSLISFSFVSIQEETCIPLLIGIQSIACHGLYPLSPIIFWKRISLFRWLLNCLCAFKLLSVSETYLSVETSSLVTKVIIPRTRRDSEEVHLC